MTGFRRMGDPDYRADQWSRLREPHIAPFTDLVDELAGTDRRLPYVAPINGGVDARVLSLLASPGRSTERDESGMLSIQNEDGAAERMGHLLAEAGIPASELLPWNAYPWYGRNGNELTTSDLDAGVEPVRKVLDRAPRLGIVLLHGHQPRKFWDRFRRVYPARAAALRAIPTWSTADRVFTTARRDEFLADLRDAMATAAEILRTVDSAS